MSGLEVDRVAEILVTLSADGPGRRGSGYRVTAQTVLTAAHVVHSASKVQARFDADQAGEWLADVIDVLEVPEIDVALLTITPPDDAEVVPARFGRIAERDAVIECSAVGFPLWKLRDAPAGPYRDSAHIVGSAAVLANRREGSLEITIVPPERDPDPQVSPWQGMSGAAVFSRGRIVGIISRHHRSDGPGRLAASRVDGWRERVSSVQQQEMNARLGMRPWLRKLEDVIVPSPGELVASAYLAQVRDIAPEQLMGRGKELAELVTFCAGPAAYQWWQGDPWAGKTALAAWFVLHPPAGVRVASFFITARLDDQSGSAAFTEAMIDQLAVIAGEPAATATSAAARDGLRRHLIETAAARIRERGERLVLVVDGLDEDTGVRPGGGQPSIASLLPRHPPDGVRVLVTSREQPPLPSDVPNDHPLYACRKRKLAVLPFAHGIEQAAENELRLRLYAGGGDREVIALITASGGGLAAAELAELTGMMHFEIQDRLGTVLGRSLYNRARYDAEDERVYLFAHETLRATADKILHADLGRYRRKIHIWAGKYRAQGWPETTPRYLLRPYGRLLTALGDARRLAAIGADSVRHDRMLQRTAADTTALNEITAAQDLLHAGAAPDLAALALLAAERDRIADRSWAIPHELPTVWARLGQTRHGLDLARSITDPLTRAQALTALAIALNEDPTHAAELATEAEQAARAATDPWQMWPVLLDIATAFTDSEPEYSKQLADEAKYALDNSAVLSDQELEADIARVRAAVGDWDVAEDSARSVLDPEQRAQALAEVASYLARDAPGRAARLADAAEEAARDLRNDRPRTLVSIARSLSGSDPARAARLTDEAEEAARADPSQSAQDLVDLASALAEIDPARAASLVGDAERMLGPGGYAGLRGIEREFAALALAAAGLPDQAEQAADAVDSGSGQAYVLCRVAGALASRHPEHGVRLAEKAEHVARFESGHWEDGKATTALAAALAAAGQPDRAEQVAATMIAPPHQHDVFTALAAALAESGQPDRAQRAARTITYPGHLAHALAVVASALAVSQPELAVSLAEEAWHRADRIEPWLRIRVLSKVARALAASHPGQAAELASDAEACANSTRENLLNGDEPVVIVSAYAAAGRWEHAERITRHIADPDRRARALAEIAQALGDSQSEHSIRLFADAEKVARTVADSGLRAATLVAVAWAQMSALPTTTGTEQRMHRLLAQALVTDRWLDIVPTLGKFAPEAVVALHDWTVKNGVR